MTAPPPYPRVAHLVAGRGTRDDLERSPGEVTDFLAQPVVVEEKVDGANVVIWMEDSQVTCALRSGPGAMDRAGQLGPLRAWLAQHDEALRKVVPDGVALYAEWLLLTHSVAYDRLPAYLVALDLWRADSGFAGVDGRNRALRDTGIATPPELWRGVTGTAVAVEGMMGPSAWDRSSWRGLWFAGSVVASPVWPSSYEPGSTASTTRAGTRAAGLATGWPTRTLPGAEPS